MRRMRNAVQSPPSGTPSSKAIGPISLARKKAAMAGATGRTRQSELAPGKTKGTQIARFSLSRARPAASVRSERSSPRGNRTNECRARGAESPQGCRAPGKGGSLGNPATAERRRRISSGWHGGTSRGLAEIYHRAPGVSRRSRPAAKRSRKCTAGACKLASTSPHGCYRRYEYVVRIRLTACLSRDL